MNLRNNTYSSKIQKRFTSKMNVVNLFIEYLSHLLCYNPYYIIQSNEYCKI